MRRVPPQLHFGINALEISLLVATVLFATVWFFRQVQRAIQGQALNVPKYLLLAAAIPMHWVVLLTPMPNKTIAIVAILTIYHNLQYHRLIWFHNKKYTSGEDGKARYGAAELISRRLLYYIAFGLLFGLWYQLPRQFIGRATDPTTLPLNLQLLSSFFWGYAFIHYYLDSKIWRVRRDPSVGRALRME